MAKYKKIKEIGKGNFGVVDLVEDESGRKWAMKTFTPPTLPGITAEELRARFEREVRYQVQIDHPNVVKIRDYDLGANPPWFVMDLAHCSLADELKADRTMGGDPTLPSPTRHQGPAAPLTQMKSRSVPAATDPINDEERWLWARYVRSDDAKLRGPLPRLSACY
jgi:Protein kinase domain